MDPSPRLPAPRAGRPIFLVGRDEHECWVVREATGRCAGIFIDRAAALRFARGQGEADIRWMGQIRLFDTPS